VASLIGCLTVAPGGVGVLKRPQNISQGRAVGRRVCRALPMDSPGVVPTQRARQVRCRVPGKPSSLWWLWPAGESGSGRQRSRRSHTRSLGGGRESKHRGTRMFRSSVDQAGPRCSSRGLKRSLISDRAWPIPLKNSMYTAMGTFSGALRPLPRSRSSIPDRSERSNLSGSRT
jgi:hypothetical protein